MGIQTEQDYGLVVQSAFDQLLADYLNSNHRKRTDVIVKAFNLARAAHEGAKRKSGFQSCRHASCCFFASRWHLVSLPCLETGLLGSGTDGIMCPFGPDARHEPFQ